MIFIDLTCQNLKKNVSQPPITPNLNEKPGLVRRMEGTRSERETRKGRKERSIEMHHTCITLIKTNLINKMTRKFLEQ